MKDHLGNDLKVGDRVVYVTRHGSNMKMTEAKVLELLGEKVRVQPVPYRWSRDESRKPVLLGTPGYVVRINEPSLPRSEEG